MNSNEQYFSNQVVGILIELTQQRTIELLLFSGNRVEFSMFGLDFCAVK